MDTLIGPLLTTSSTQETRKRTNTAITEEQAANFFTFGIAKFKEQMQQTNVLLPSDPCGLPGFGGGDYDSLHIRPSSDKLRIFVPPESCEGDLCYVGVYSDMHCNELVLHGYRELCGILLTPNVELTETMLKSGNFGVTHKSIATLGESTSSVGETVGEIRDVAGDSGEREGGVAAQKIDSDDGWWGRWNKKDLNRTVKDFLAYCNDVLMPSEKIFKKDQSGRSRNNSRDQFNRIMKYRKNVSNARDSATDKVAFDARLFVVSSWDK